MPLYVDWSLALFKDLPKLSTYIRQELSGGVYFSQEKCELDNHSWVTARVVNQNGQFIMNLDVCVSLEYDASNAYIMVFTSGLVQFKNLRNRTISEIFQELLESAIRSAQVIAVIAAALGLGDLSSMLTALNSSVGSLYTTVEELTKPVIDAYQRSTAWIEKTFNVDLIKRIDSVVQAISPEYKSFTRSYESELADISNKIFGNTSTFSMYMKFYELMMYQQIQAAGADKDTARVETLKKSYERSRTFREKIEHYTWNPLNVWGDLYAFTFEDMNPYIEKEKALRNAETIKLLNDLAEIARKVDQTVLNIGRFAQILEVDITSGKHIPLKTITDYVAGVYDELVDPVVRAVESENRKIDSEIKVIMLAREKEKEARDRAALMSKPVQDLTPFEKKQQITHFNNMFIESIAPEIKEIPVQLQDIEKVIGAIYE